MFDGYVHDNFRVQHFTARCGHERPRAGQRAGTLRTCQQPVKRHAPSQPLDFAKDPQHARRMNYWLVKSEPEAYSWAQFMKDRGTAWTGVRNFAARLNLRAMRRGDLVCFYHSVTGKEVVGVAQVTKEAYPDPTAEGEDWSCVDLAPVKALHKPVPLEAIKADPLLAQIPLVRQSRLSVSALNAEQFAQVLKLGKTQL
jgi:predicted RNA-binding protein with PUA-like domain